MHMTPNFNLGMLKQTFSRLLAKVSMILLILVVAVNAAAGERYRKERVVGESLDRNVSILIDSNLDNVGGLHNAIANKQVRCLAENIYHESRGESLQGQIAVGKVTMNRLEEGYASTVCGVVKQRSLNGCQFSWVCKGLSTPAGQLWNQAVGIALTIMNDPEEVQDPTNGATHFHATYVTWQPGWQRIKNSVNRIGNHVFYRIKPKEEK